MINGVSLIFDWNGRLTFLPFNVHVNKNSLATILSIKYLDNIVGVRITINKSIEKSMNVILTDQTVFKIKECGLELYYYDRAFTDEKNSYKTDATIIPYSLLSTVTENK